MKKCNECNLEMIEECRIKGTHPYEYNVNKSVEIYMHIPTGQKRNILGFQYDVTKPCKLKARICPKCGKVELYTELNNKLDN